MALCRRPLELEPLTDSPRASRNVSRAVTKTFNITPHAQMVLTDTQTLIFETGRGMRPTQKLHASHTSREKGASSKVLVGERKKSLGPQPLRSSSPRK